MNDVNLIPYHRRIRQRRKARLWLWFWLAGGYFCLMIIVLSSVYLMWKVNDQSLSRDLDTLTRRIENDRSSVRQLRQERAKVSSIYTTSRAIHHQPDWSKLLILLGDNLDDDIILNNCQVVTLDEEGREVSGLKQAELTPASMSALVGEPRHVLTLSGYGLEQRAVSQFVVRLEQSGLFESVSMTHSLRQDFLNQKAIAFNIQCRI